MNVFAILTLLWNWSRTVFGSIFVFCVLVSLVLLIVELLYYHGKKRRSEGNAGESDAQREALR